MKNLLCFGILPAFLVSASASATTEAVANGGFETGTGSSPSGWTLHSGTWTSSSVTTTDTYGSDSVIITDNTSKDSLTGGNLYQVFAGNQSFRLGNSTNGAHWASASQDFSSYSSANLYFAFAVVLDDPNHLASEMPKFVFRIKDNTTNTFLFNFAVTADSTNVNWLAGSGSWKYTNWQSVNLDTSSVIGHDLSLFVASYDCSLGGHGGYAYIDGFSTVAGSTPNPGVIVEGYVPVPEPSTYGLMLGGLALAGVVIRRRRAK